MRQALKSVSSKEELEVISKRLANYREQLNLSFLVALMYSWRETQRDIALTQASDSDRVDLAAIANARSFEGLEESTQSTITAIFEKRSIFDSSLAI